MDKVYAVEVVDNRTLVFMVVAEDDAEAQQKVEQSGNVKYDFPHQEVQPTEWYVRGVVETDLPLEATKPPDLMTFLEFRAEIKRLNAILQNEHVGSYTGLHLLRDAMKEVYDRWPKMPSQT
jgi:hypothetical protein